jgi:hypothetical protein
MWQHDTAAPQHAPAPQLTHKAGGPAPRALLLLGAESLARHQADTGRLQPGHAVCMSPAAPVGLWEDHQAPVPSSSCYCRRQLR